MTEIASLLVTIGADISDLKRGLDDTEAGIDNLGTRLAGGVSNIGGQFVRTGAAINELAAPLRNFGAQGLQTAADFDSIMAEISARTGVVGSDLETVRQFALQMGADTSFSAQQAGEAFLQLLSSGQSTQEAFATLPAVLDAAAASGEDLGRTADVLTDIMASYGLGVEEATDVTNVLAQAAGASSADMASLGQGFANVGGVAKAFGLSVEDTAAVLAVLSENGIKGAEAGTALKSMLLNMTRPTEDVQGEWSALGLSMYDAMGNARPLEEVITDLDRVLDGLSAEEQNDVMQTLAGSYGITALTALRGSISIDKMRESMRSQAGASDVAQARMDTFKGRMDSLRGSVETLMIVGLTPLMNDVLTPLAETMTEVINGVTDWANANPELTSAIVAVGGALAIAGPALIALGTAITLAAPAVAVLGTVFAALVSPIVLVGAALAGLAYIASQFIDFGQLATNIQTGISDALDDANIDLSSLPGKISAAITGLDFTEIQTGLETAIGGIDIGTNITGAFATPIDTSGIESVMETHFNDILTAVVSVVGIVFGGPVAIGFGIARLVSLAIENDFLGIKTFLDGSGITQSITDAFNGIQDTVNTIIQSVFGGEQQQIDIGSKFSLKNADDLGKGGLSGPIATFIDDIQTGLTFLRDTFGPAIQTLGDGIAGFVQNLSGTETEGLLRVVTVIVGAIGGIVAGVAADVITAIGNALPDLGSAISDFITGFSRIGEGDMGGAAVSFADAVTNFVNSIGALFGIDLQIPDFSTALDGFQTAFDSIPIILAAIQDQVARGVNNLVSGIRAAIRDIEQVVLDAQIKAADIQIGLGINYDANVADKESKQAQLNASNLAENLETGLTTGLATSNITIDPAQYVNVDYAALASKITNPLLIQDALTQAMAEGDQQALDVLLPLATELGIDTQSIVDQFAASLTTASTAQIYNATLTADVLVYAGHVDLGPLRGAINDAIAKGNLAGGVPQVPGVQPAAAVPHLATGGQIISEGLAYLHAGEVVMNRQQQSAASGGGKGGPSIGSLVIQTNDAQKLLFDLKVMGIDLEAMAKPS